MSTQTDELVSASTDRKEAAPPLAPPVEESRDYGPDEERLVRQARADAFLRLARAL